MLLPITGYYIPLSQIPDPVFSQGTMGPGFAVEPTTGQVRAPFAGHIQMLHKNWHALIISSEGLSSDPLSFLIHIGIDSVLLNQKGFKSYVTEGQNVVAGQLLLEFDLDFLADHISHLTTPIVCVQGDFNFDRLPSGFYQAGHLWEGRSPSVVTEVKDESEIAAYSETQGQTFQYQITSLVGLHARPAAQWVQQLKEVPCEVWVTNAKGVRINAKSVLNLLSLGLGYKDTFTVEFMDSQLDCTSCLNDISTWAQIFQPSESLLWICSQDVMAPIRKMKMTPMDIESLAYPKDLDAIQQIEYFKSQHQDLVNQVQEELASLPSGVEADILQAHLEIINDADLWQEAMKRPNNSESTAYSPPIVRWYLALEEKRQQLQALVDQPYLQERAMDIYDVQQRLWHQIQGLRFNASHTQPFIAIAKWITPSLFIKWKKMGMVGLLTQEGGAQSHVAILAKSVPMAYVSHISDSSIESWSDDNWLWIQGSKQKLILNPNQDQQQHFLAHQELQARQQQRLIQYAQQGPVKTVDGKSLLIYANIAHPSEAKGVQHWGADGIGLVRSEFLFMDRRSPPTLEEQKKAYLQILQQMGSKQDRVIIRTFDVGGDKPISYLQLDHEDNPFLGRRGARLYSQYRELFLIQLEALYQAYQEYVQIGGHANLGVMLPMLSQLAEWDQLQGLGLPALDYGVMMEVPSALIRANHWAQKVSFMSIGSNDLTQYTLAMDRGLAALSSQADGLDPAVLDLMNHAAKAGLDHNCPVGICGGLGSDVLALPYLVGMQLHEISVSLPQVPLIKTVLAQLRFQDCQQLLTQALELQGAADVRQLSQNFYYKKQIQLEV